jgi:beta-lactamase superfamily II metal-dependent hydrolase
VRRCCDISIRCSCIQHGQVSYRLFPNYFVICIKTTPTQPYLYQYSTITQFSTGSKMNMLFTGDLNQEEYNTVANDIPSAHYTILKVKNN